MKKFYNKFSSKKELIEGLLSLNPEAFNVSATQQMNAKASRNRYFLVDKTDFTRVCDNFKKFMYMFNHVSGIKVYHKICFGNGHIFHVFTEGDVFNVGGEGGNLGEKPVVPKQKEVIKEAIVTPEEITDLPEDQGINLTEYEALYDDSKKRNSKDQLERKVRKDFGIDLNKRNPFDGMIEELRTELAKR